MSVSSFEGSPVPVDLPSKYQKLAGEYAKIRAQVGVLKKAVVEEQARTADLKENLKTKDQNLRKAEQELDSLNFRNQQLTKRVTILQDELDAFQNSSKKGKSKSSSNEPPTSVIIEELEMKISENAYLVSLLQEKNDTYEKEKFKLMQEQETYEHELRECKKALSTIEETKLAKLESENKALELKLSTKEEELKRLHNEMRYWKNDNVDRNHVPSNSGLVERFSKVIQSLPIQELLSSLSNFFLSLDARCQKTNPNTSRHKLSECIKKHQSYLGSLADEYLKFSSNVVIDEDLLTGFTQLIISVNNVGDSLEDLTSSLNSSSEDVNKVFKEVIASFKKHWIQLNSVLKVCLSPIITPTESEDCVTRIADVFRSLRSTCDYFTSALNEKFKLSPVDEEEESQMMSALSKTSTLGGVMYKKITENTETLSQVIDYRPPVSIADKVSRLPSEQCCEHWKQEYELLKMTHSKKIKDLEEQISCLSGATTPRSNNSSNIVQSPVEGKGEPSEVTNMFGTLSAPLAFNVDSEGQESEMKKYFNCRANILIADRQLAESKVTALRSECEVLQKRLEHSLECRLVLEASVKQAQDTVSRLQEELTTTTTNYEMQLSSMSEHVANMNDKLTLQQEEIEQLTYQLSTKDSKKGKTK